jgi:cell division protein FtsW
MDISVFVFSLLFLVMGVVFVYSSSFPMAMTRFDSPAFFFFRQVLRAGLAVTCFFVFMHIDYRVWARLSGIGFIAAVILLVLVLAMPDSAIVKGAKRWISLGPVTFQVSEFARMVLIINLAHKLARTKERIATWSGIVPHIAKIGIIAGLIVAEPDFSTAAIITFIGLAMIFVAGGKPGHILSFCAAGAVMAFLSVMTTPYRFERVKAFLNSTEYEKTTGYQTMQALIGLGNGGLFGTGIGKGEQKFFFLPEPHTDFTFAIIGEEIGFVGLMVVLACVGFLVFKGLRIAKRCDDPTGSFMAYGFTCSLALYIILHSAVNTGLVPVTGVPFPFLSYGGMNLVFTMISLGILLNISSQAPRRTTGEQPADRFDSERRVPFRTGMSLSARTFTPSCERMHK